MKTHFAYGARSSAVFTVILMVGYMSLIIAACVTDVQYTQMYNQVLSDKWVDWAAPPAGEQTSRPDASCEESGTRIVTITASWGYMEQKRKRKITKITDDGTCPSCTSVGTTYDTVNDGDPIRGAVEGYYWRDGDCSPDAIG